MTESEKLVMGVESEALLQTASARESWRIFGIMSEFVEATERLAAIKPAVTIFGSARIKPGTPYYDLAEKTARLLSDSGFSVISGGGPGIMEAANKGAFYGYFADFPPLFRPQIHVRPFRQRLCCDARRFRDTG